MRTPQPENTLMRDERSYRSFHDCSTDSFNDYNMRVPQPENILIVDDALKLADFGSCRGIYSKQPYT